MREELLVRLQGTWQWAERPDESRVAAALAPFDAELTEILGAGPGELRLLITLPASANLIAVGEAVADALALPSPRISYERDLNVPRGAAGPGYYCTCGGVDGDHVEGCPRAGT